MTLPTEPPATEWRFPSLSSPAYDPVEGPADDLIAVGADLEPGTLLLAYRRGYFPMPYDESGTPSWWSPHPRGILPLDGLRVTRSMRQSAKRFEIRVDTAFSDVMLACGDPRRDGAWIDQGILAAYAELHRLGWAHSIETWREGRLVGGLYGVAIGGLFAGESMFHHERDASKVALMALVDLLDDGHPDRLLDVQWSTEHLASLGVIEVARSDYLKRLQRALELPQPRF